MQKSDLYKGNITAKIMKIGIITISIGIIVMLITVATGVGIKKEIQKKITFFNGHITVAPFENTNANVSIVSFEKNDSLIVKIKKAGGIAHWQEVAYKAAIFKKNNDFEGVILKGVARSYDYKKIQKYIQKGRFINKWDTISNEILISQNLARKLKLKIGNKISAFFQSEGKKNFPNRRNFEVVGIYKSDFPNFDNNLAFIDIKHIQKINRWEKNHIGGIEIFINNFNNIEQKADQIYDNIPVELDVTTLKYHFNTIFEWMNIFDYNIAIIITIMIIVGTINMITALLVLILESTKMIAVLKTLGYRYNNIRKVFLINAIYILSRGLFWGNAIGIILLLIQKKWKLIRLNPELYFVNAVPIDISLKNIFLLNIFIFSFCIFILWLPTFLINKISPSKILKFQ